jgi:hypothetical protein
MCAICLLDCVCLCKHTYLWACICMWNSVYLWERFCMLDCVCLCEHTYLWTFNCMWNSVCVWERIYMLNCICLWERSCLQRPPQPNICEKRSQFSLPFVREPIMVLASYPTQKYYTSLTLTNGLAY